MINDFQFRLLAVEHHGHAFLSVLLVWKIARDQDLQCTTHDRLLLVFPRINACRIF